jgi:F-type H+-transporting ATPase subunit b
MKKILFVLSCILPLALFANEANIETDILQRSVNFIIFVAITYYLIADKIKTFFKKRTLSIQSELYKVQQLLKESENKVKDAKQEIKDAQKLALDIVDTANADISIIKTKISDMTNQEIINLSKSFDDKLIIETKKVKNEVVTKLLESLLSSENIVLSKKDLANIILKKVA